MPSVDEILSAYCADRKPVVAQPDRIDSTIERLRPIIGSLSVSDLTRDVLLKYTAQRVAGGVQPQTARRELITLRAALRMAWRDGVIDRVPHVPLPPPGCRRDRVVSAEEIRAVLAASAARPRGNAFLRLLVATCGRVSAVCELPWRQVDLERREIDLRTTSPLAARMKGRAVVPIGADLVAFLRAYRDAPAPDRRRRGRKLAPGDRVVGLSVSCARQCLHDAARAAGVDGVTPHVIRHSVATHMIRSGVPITHVSRMLGHASVSITADIYGHLVTDDLVPAAELLQAWVR